MKAIFTIGVPRCGKTTWCFERMRQMNQMVSGRIIRLCPEDFRLTLTGMEREQLNKKDRYFKKELDIFIDNFWRNAPRVLQNTHLVFDECNLNWEELRKRVGDLAMEGYEIEFCIFPKDRTEITCERDKKLHERYQVMMDKLETKSFLDFCDAYGVEIFHVKND